MTTNISAQNINLLNYYHKGGGKLTLSDIFEFEYCLCMEHGPFESVVQAISQALFLYIYVTLIMVENVAQVE